MFNRVNAFLEAIDKKTEEIADAAEEEDIARTIQQQQQQQQEQYHRHLRSSVAGSAVSSPHHGSSGGVPVGMAVAGGAPSLTVRSHPTFSNMGNSGSATPMLLFTSPSVRTSAQLQQVSEAAGEPHTTFPQAPLLLPTKLPSFDPPRLNAGKDTTRDSGGRQRGEIAKRGPSDSNIKAVVKSTDSSSPTARPSSSNSNNNASGSVSAVDLGAEPPSSLPNFTHESTVERLEARCAALETDKLRWQQEAAIHKAQCGAARDALWKAEQEARSYRTAQRDAERALAAYRETSQRLLEEAQHQLRIAQASNTCEDSAVDATRTTGDLSATQREELVQAREVRQRLELLQAEHAARLAEVKRFQDEAAKATAELQRVQGTCRQAQAQVDTLQLDLQAAEESLEGEVAAHADTKRLLRALQSHREAQQQRQSGMSDGVGSSGGNTDLSINLKANLRSDGGAGTSPNTSADVAQLQSELKEAKQRQQMLLLQISNKQTLLDSAGREIADLTARYNELARQFDDARVEVVAGFRSPTLPSSEYGGVGSGSGPHYVRNTVGQKQGEAGGNLGAYSDKTGLSTFGGASGTTSGSINAHDALKRNPAMVRLTRQYGAAGQAVVAALSAMDVAALRLGRLLTQTRWVWRVVLMGYIALLQLWVVVLVLVNMVSEAVGEGYDFPFTTTSAP